MSGMSIYIYVYINFKAINNVLDAKMVLKTHFSLKYFAYFTEASSVYLSIRHDLEIFEKIKFLENF